MLNRLWIAAALAAGGLVVLGTGSQATSAAARAVLPPGGAAILTWTPAQQAWGYKNMEKINPFHTIKRGDRIHPLPKAPVQIDPTFTAGGKPYDTASYMVAFRASGVLVIKDGKIKSLDDPVTRYVPELKGSAYEGVTVRQLITMTSGVKWNENYTDPNSDVAKVGLSVIEPGVNPVVSYMRRLPREAAPGSKFVYKTGETDLAGILLSNAVAEPISQYLSEKIWQPYGMEQDGVWVDDVAGHERGGCCISMTLRDYGRFGLFTLELGKVEGREVLPAGWMQDATSPHVENPPYGYFWWLIPGGYEAEGIFGQTVSIFPSDHLVVVINSAWPGAWVDDIDKIRMQYLQAIRAAAR